MSKYDSHLKCSFCGKTQDQVRKLIAGPGVYICDECVDLSNEILDEELFANGEATVNYLKSKIEFSSKHLEILKKFSTEAIRVMINAREEAHRLRHNFVGTEQILIALIREDKGGAAQVLQSIGVSLNDIIIEVERLIGWGIGMKEGEVPLTPAAEKLIEYASEEAQQLNSNYIGTEHLLLGLIRLGGF